MLFARGRLRKARFQLELDENRGAASLPVRAGGLRQARVAGDAAAERQALIDLAAVCVALAARVPLPRLGLTESHRGRAGRSRAMRARRRAA